MTTINVVMRQTTTGQDGSTWLVGSTHTASLEFAAGSPTASQIDTDGLEVDGLLLVRTFLSANTMNGTPAQFLHTVDLHYQSTNVGTKNKAPNFYA